MSRPRTYLKKTAVNLPPVHAAYVAYYSQLYDISTQEVLRRIIQTFVDKDRSFQPADFSRYVQKYVIPNEEDTELAEVLKEQVAALVRARKHADAIIAAEAKASKG